MIGQFTQEDPIGIAGGLDLYGYAGGDPVNFSDPFGLCRRRLFRFLGDEVCKTRDEAAMKAAEAIGDRSVRSGREFGGEIVAVDDGFQYTGPRQGSSRFVRIKTGIDGFAGFYHSHPPGTSSDFSPEDRRIADDTRQPAYLITSDGQVKRYDPGATENDDEQVTVIGKPGGDR